MRRILLLAFLLATTAALAADVSVQAFEVTGVTDQCFIRDTAHVDGGAWEACPGGGVSDGDKGDISVSGGGATWTVDNDVVTYAKMQNVSVSDRVLGRDTAGAGDVEELTVGAVLDMITTSSAHLLYRTGVATWAATAFSTDGNGAIWPDTDLLASLGGTTKRWAEVFTAALDNNGGTITVDGHLTPDGDAQQGLGSAFLRWTNIHVQYIGGGGDISIGDSLVPDGAWDLGSTTDWWDQIFVQYVETGYARAANTPVSTTGTATFGEGGGRAQVSANGGAASNIITAADRCEMWPVGAVFISVSSTSPATSLGCGTWSAFGAGRTLVSLNGADADFDTSEETGGAKTQTPSAHAGTAVTTHGDHFHNYSGVVAHSHTYKSLTASTGGATGYEHGAIDTSSTQTNEGGATDSTGLATQTTTSENQELTHSVTQPSDHSAMSVVQPYIVVYMWKRTA